MILGRCKWCNSPLEQKPRGRNRVFCSEECRTKFKEEEEIANGWME